MKTLTLALLSAALLIISIAGTSYQIIRLKRHIEAIPKERHTVVVQSIGTNNAGIIFGSVQTTDMDTIKGETVWDRDDQRKAYQKVVEREKWRVEFNRTNTNPNAYAYKYAGEAEPVTGRPGQLELGYRPDGVVVWRVLPEVPTNSVVMGYRAAANEDAPTVVEWIKSDAKEAKRQ